MKVGRAIAILLLLVGPGLRALAEDALTVEAAADAVLKAVEARDDVALKALAERNDPDPWLVADELLRCGEGHAALAFAKAAPRDATDALPAYVGTRQDAVAEEAARQAVARMNESADRGDAKAALVAAGSVESSPRTVTGIRLRYGAGLALLGLGRIGDAAQALHDMAEAAEQLGWLGAAASAMHESGRCGWLRSDLANAHARLERAVALYERVDRPLGAAAALQGIGLVHIRREAWSSSREHLERALALYEEEGDRSGVAATLGPLGNVCYQTGAWREALSCWERRLELLEERADRRGVAQTLVNLGAARAALGEHRKALSYYERSVALHEEFGDRARLGTTLMNMGRAHMDLGEWAVALSCLRRSLALQEETGNRGDLAWTLGSLGSVQRRLGDWPEALSFFERALVLHEELGDRTGAARMVGNIGIMHAHRGAWAKALAFYRRSLALREELGDRGGVAAVLGNMGNAHRSLGDWPQALRFHERALSLKEELGDRTGMAWTLLNIGAVYDSLADYEKAFAYHERAQALMQEIGNRAGVAAALNNRGATHLARGALQEARKCLERALAMQEELGARGLTCGTLDNLGLVEQALGRLPEAVSLHRRALDLAEELGDRDGTATVLHNMGLAHARQGDLTRASRVLDRSLRLARRLRSTDTEVRSATMLARVRLDEGKPAIAFMIAREAQRPVESLLGGLAEAEGSAAREQYAGIYGVGALAAARLDMPTEALTFLESGRAGSLLETLGGGHAVRFVDLPQALLEAEADANALESRARWEYGRALDEGKRKVIRRAARAVDEAMEVRREVAARIQREAKRVAGVFYPRAATLEEIQGWMEPGMALVVYGLCLDEALALVVTPADARIVSLGTVKDVEAACASLGCDDPDTTPADALAALRTLLVEPLALPDDVKTVLVSPDGALGYVPWGALFDRPVACVPSGTTWVLLREEEREAGDKILALGDPDYSARPDDHAVAIYTRGGRLTPLPATRDEAKAIGDVVLLGQEASEPALTEALQKEKRWRAVHLACHGLVDPARPTLSSLALTPTEEDDGFLTCLDIFRMQVPADLVTLSACETARGKVYKAEGIVGLTRAFMYAGAPRVLCSLWKVDDEATRALMTKFYELWNPKEGDGLPVAEALRQAQAHVRSQEKWAHPYYWAAWVLWGLAE